MKASKTLRNVLMLSGAILFTAAMAWAGAQTATQPATNPNASPQSTQQPAASPSVPPSPQAAPGGQTEQSAQPGQAAPPANPSTAAPTATPPAQTPQPTAPAPQTTAAPGQAPQPGGAANGSVGVMQGESITGCLMNAGGGRYTVRTASGTRELMPIASVSSTLVNQVGREVRLFGAWVPAIAPAQNPAAAQAATPGGLAQLFEVKGMQVIAPQCTQP